MSKKVMFGVLIGFLVFGLVGIWFVSAYSQMVEVTTVEEQQVPTAQNDSSDYGISEPVLAVDDNTVADGQDWDEFQDYYDLALLDEKNGGDVFGRRAWDDYWYLMPFWLQNGELEDEAKEAARLSLDLLDRGDWEATAEQISDLEHLAGIKAK